MQGSILTTNWNRLSDETVWNTNNSTISSLRFLRGKCTQTKIEHILQAISKLWTLFLKNKVIILRQIVSETQKMPIKFLEGLVVLELFMQNIVLINNSRTDWSMKFSVHFLSFSDNLLQDAYIIFPKNVDQYEIVHKTWAC